MMIGTRHLPVGETDYDEEMLCYLKDVDQSKQLTKRQLQSHLKKGRELFESNFLEDAKMSQHGSGHKIVARCKGSNDTRYNLDLGIDEKSCLSHIECNCPYFTKGDANICKHTVALLLWTCEQLEAQDKLMSQAQRDREENTLDQDQEEDEQGETEKAKENEESKAAAQQQLTD